MSVYIWTKIGCFDVATTSLNVLAKAGTFDEEFRDFARKHRARWDGLEKAWVFPIAKEAELLHGLENLTAKKISAAALESFANSKIAQDLKMVPFSFASAKLHIETDMPNLRFVVKFPYNEMLSQTLRQAGGRWSPEIHAYTAPFSALDTLRKISAEPRLENELFLARNASFFAAEACASFSDWMDAQQSSQGLHLLKIEAQTLRQTYKITFPFALQSILGQEVILPHLRAAGVLDPVRLTDLDRMYPRINLNSSVFEFCQRPALMPALSLIRKQLDEIGPYTNIYISHNELKKITPNRRIEPQSGEFILRGNQAWLIANARQRNDKICLQIHPVLSSIAERKIKTLNPLAKMRICEISGIDILAFEAHVESLGLMATSCSAQREPPSAKKMRL